tara:strand:+ start:601 stop:1116 length:516 start_codon:yes stop_codon:yes gene_type:complete
MNEKERIEFIKIKWREFLKKYSKKNIDISKIQSIDQVKQALRVKQAVEYVSQEFNVNLTDEQVVLLSDAIIEKTVLDEKAEMKEIKSREGRPYFFSQDTFLMIKRLEYAILIKEIERYDRPEINELYEDIQEPDIEKLNRSLEKNGVKVEKRDDYSTIKGYHLVDIVGKGN